MEASVHGHDFLVAELAEDETAFVTFDGADGEVGYVFVFDDELFLYFFGEVAKACAEYDGYFRLCVHLLFEPCCCF